MALKIPKLPFVLIEVRGEGAMPAVAIDVDPAAYDAASRVFGLRLAEPMARAGLELSWALESCAGMAGCDDGGRAWGGEYDEAARSAVQGVGDAAQACYRLAALVQQSGFNHAMADEASVPGSGGVAVDHTEWDGYCVETLLTPPSSVGPGNGSLPGHWGLIEHLVGVAWPNGHQDRLRRAAAAWRRVADVLSSAAWGVPEALVAIGGQRSPEIPRATEYCEQFQQHLHDLADTCSGLATACEDYAGVLDRCRSEVEHLIGGFIRDSAVIQGVGFGLAWAGGVSEALAQGAQASRVAALAVRVAEVIRDCVAAIEAVAAVVRATVAAGAARALAGLRVIKDLKVVVMQTVDGGLPVARLEMAARGAVQARSLIHPTTALRRLVDRLAKDGPRGLWRTVRLQKRHFGDHGHQFGSRTADDYTRAASDLLERAVKERLPVKIDEDDVVRVYDPASNTFGSYNPDGTIRTFFKPDRPGEYWDEQPGVSPWN